MNKSKDKLNEKFIKILCKFYVDHHHIKYNALNENKYFFTKQDTETLKFAYEQLVRLT
jgi:hypothetical protein